MAVQLQKLQQQNTQVHTTADGQIIWHNTGKRAKALTTSEPHYTKV
jgi:hypothetical protein